MREEILLHPHLDRDVIGRVSMLAKVEPAARRQREHIQEATFIRI
jgi:hypothetical protein